MQTSLSLPHIMQPHAGVYACTRRRQTHHGVSSSLLGSWCETDAVRTSPETQLGAAVVDVHHYIFDVPNAAAAAVELQLDQQCAARHYPRSGVVCRAV